MTEIEMERKPRRNTWVWVAVALLVVVLAVGAYLLFARGTMGADAAPTAERPGVTEPYGTQPAPDPLQTPEEARRP
jgi:hypothetical protein